MYRLQGIWHAGSPAGRYAALAGKEPDRVSKCYRTMDEWVDEQRARDGWPEDPLKAVLRERGRGKDL